MGRHYKRKTYRASWTSEALDEAMTEVTNKKLGINQASREYGIPSRTLRRHLRSGKGKGPLGRCSELGTDYEKKLVNHIQALEKVGFSPNKADVQSLAFNLAEKMNVKHRFSREKEKAGDEWFYAFMRRNKEIVLRKSEGLSLARVQGMNRKNIENYFNVLKNILVENNLMKKPGKIYNVDETGIQVNNKAGKVLATKGAKEVYTITSTEKGENISVIACCSAEGQFLPPVLIFKGKNKKPEFFEGLPPGSDVYMNQKSSYISSELFYKWFTQHFLPKKGPGKALLVLDGHGSHSNSIELLEAAAANDVILLCLPSHTTHALQPLDRAFFKPFKTYFNQEAKLWMTIHKERKLTRYYISQLIGKAWCKAATISTGISAMRSTGVYPFNPLIIPDYFFCIDAFNNEPAKGDNLIITSSRPEIAIASTSGFDEATATSLMGHVEPLTTSPLTERTNQISPSILSPELIPESSTIDLNTISGPSVTTPKRDTFTDSFDIRLDPPISNPTKKKDTPSKVLRDILPIPVIPQYQTTSRKQKTTVLTSPEFMAKKAKLKEKKTTTKQKTTKEKENRERISKKKKIQPSHIFVSKKRGNSVAQATKKKRRQHSFSSESQEDHIEICSSSEKTNIEDDACIECLEDYKTTKRKVDWIQCIRCLKWLHENCTMYASLCNECGRYNVRQQKK